MTRQPWRLGAALGELRRRHVYRVVGAYAISIWVVIEIADVVLPALMAPHWVMSVIVLLAALGFPIAAVLAWAFDITPQGVVRTPPSNPQHSTGFHWQWRWVDYIIIALLLGILAFILIRSPERLHAPDIARSIAVMPFSDLSPEQDTGYFSDGMAEAILDSLTAIADLQVAARTSSFALRNSKMSVQEVAETLHVGTLLEGSVRKSGDRLRISTRLIDAKTGHNLWSDTFEGSLEDIFSVQDAISRAVVQTLQIHLAGNDRLIEQPTDDLVAYDHYLRGRSVLRREPSEENIREAIEHFDLALERDPGFGVARAGLCTAHWQLYETTKRSDHVERALATCEQARLQDPDRAKTQVALGNVKRGTGDLEEALAAYQKALELDPKSVDAHVGMGLTQSELGEFIQAKQHLLRAIELDPAWWRNYSYLGVLYFAQADFEKAAEQFAQATRLEPDSPSAYSNLGGALLYLGDFEGSAEAFAQSIERQPTATGYSNAGTAYYFAGNHEAAEAMFWVATELKPDDYRYRGFLAEAMALNGKPEQASKNYRQAAELARGRLQINDKDQEARASLAMYLVQFGQIKQAQAELGIMTTDDPSLGPAVHQTLAIVYLLLGDRATALDHLHAAIDGGWPEMLLAAEPRFQSLRDEPQFAALLFPDATDHETPKGHQP